MSKYLDLDKEMSKAFAEWEAAHEAALDATSDYPVYEYKPGSYHTIRQEMLAEIRHRLEAADRRWLYEFSSEEEGGE